MGAACAVSPLALGVAAQAQTAPEVGAALRENERIQREQEARRLEQIQRDRQSASPPARIEMPAPDTPAAGSSTVCRDIRTITIDGALKLSERQRSRLAAPYLNRCLTVGDIERLLGDVTKAYIDRGYSTSRAYLPEQDLTTGSLRVLVLEGRISRIELEGRGVFLDGAFLPAEGDRLNLRRLEQGIDQINRLSSNNATLDIRPGDKPGESVVVVHNEPSRRIYANLSADNLGSRSTGRNQMAFTLTGEGLLGHNELISVTRRQSRPLNDGPNRSSSENYFISYPLGPISLSGGYTASRYRTIIDTAAGVPLELRGNSHNGFGTIDLALFRNRTDRINLSTTLTVKDNESLIDGQRLDVSSRKLAVLDADLTYSSTALGGLFTLGLGYSRGLSAFDALQDAAGLPKEAPRAQFDKWRFLLSYFNGFTLGKQRVTVSSTFTAQVTGDTLYGTEQFAVGGVYSVRGFRETSLTNDKGFAWRNEVGVPISLPTVFGQPVTLKPYLGADLGYVNGNAPSTPHGTLAGGAAGAQLIVGSAFFDVFVADRFAAPAALAGEGTMLFGRFSIRL